MAKLHVRHLVGGMRRSRRRAVYRFDFPSVLERCSSSSPDEDDWNITCSTTGTTAPTRTGAGRDAVPSRELPEFAFLGTLGYPWVTRRGTPLIDCSSADEATPGTRSPSPVSSIARARWDQARRVELVHESPQREIAAERTCAGDQLVTSSFPQHVARPVRVVEIQVLLEPDGLASSRSQPRGVLLEANRAACSIDHWLACTEIADARAALCASRIVDELPRPRRVCTIRPASQLLQAVASPSVRLSKML